MNKRLTAVIQREDDGFVAFCPELDIASQGDSIQSSRENLREALELFFECASPGEIEDARRRQTLEGRPLWQPESAQKPRHPNGGNTVPNNDGSSPAVE